MTFNKALPIFKARTLQINFIQIKLYYLSKLQNDYEVLIIFIIKVYVLQTPIKTIGPQFTYL